MKGFFYHRCVFLIDINFVMCVSILTTQLCLGKHSDRTRSLSNLVFAAKFLSRNINPLKNFFVCKHILLSWKLSNRTQRRDQVIAKKISIVDKPIIDIKILRMYCFLQVIGCFVIIKSMY